MTAQELREELGPDSLRGTTGSDTVEKLLADDITIEQAKTHLLHVALNKMERKAGKGRPTEGVIPPAELLAGRTS